MVLEETLERPLDCRDIQPVTSKGNQSWVFIGRTDVEAETQPPDIWWLNFGHLMQRTDSFEKTLMLGEIEGRRRRGQQRMKWLHKYHLFKACEFEQSLGDGEGQESLKCCSLWGHKESYTT